jgi:hypothetical protein
MGLASSGTNLGKQNLFNLNTEAHACVQMLSSRRAYLVLNQGINKSPERGHDVFVSLYKEN